MSPEHLIKQHTKSLPHGHLQPFYFSVCFTLLLHEKHLNKESSRISSGSGWEDVVAVTPVPNNLNHHLNYSHNNDSGALHYEHYCWEMSSAEVKDESYLSLSVGALVMVTGPSELCSGVFIQLYAADLSQMTSWCQRPNNEMRWPSKAV